MPKGIKSINARLFCHSKLGNNLEEAASHLTGAVLVAAGALIISTAPVLVRIASVGPTMAGFYRTLFGSVFLFVIAMLGRKRFMKNKKHYLLALFPAVFFGLGLTFWHRSIHAVGPGLATILANFQVFFLAFIGLFFFKERIGVRVGVAMIVAVFGVYLLVGMERFEVNSGYRMGSLFGLSAALAYALYVTTLRKLRTETADIDVIGCFAIVSLFCAIFMGIEGWIQGESFYIPDRISWFCVIAMGIFCQALGWVLITKGLPAIPASRAGLLLLLQPTGAFIWDVLFFSRATRPVEFFGAALALIAIYFGTKDH